MLKNLRRVLFRNAYSSIRARSLSIGYKAFSSKPGGGSDEGKGKDLWEGWDSVKKGAKTQAESPSDFGFDSVSSWSTGLTRDHFDGEVVGRQVTPLSHMLREPEDASLISEDAIPVSSPNADLSEDVDENSNETCEGSDDWLDEEDDDEPDNEDEYSNRLNAIQNWMVQIDDPGSRGSYLKDSEKAEMYKLHKENPKVYTVEKLAKDYRIIRQRVHAILWLKEIEEEEERRYGPLDDSVEVLLDSCPELFESHDREFHVATLRHKPDFKVMPEDWDGTAKDPDEVHYEISKKEDEMLYQDFVTRMNFNKKQIAGMVKTHEYSRRRGPKGWNFTIEKMGPKGKHGSSGHRFVSSPDGSTKPLDEMGKLYVKRETPRRRRRIV